ncbi:MAG: AbrB family transcriptional regulator [Acidaminococcaceae bacterium]|nr:AbrB family transcriptional regulator [Acidaminococcaceae bacterium]
MLNRLLLFIMAACLGTLFLKMELPIPYLLGGIFAAVACKVAGLSVTWPKNWREVALLVTGYGIGRNFTADTWNKMTHQTFGVLEATLIAVAVAVVIAWWTARHTSANLISCVMGIMPGGLTQMMLMSEDDPRADANVVVVMQTLRLVGVIVAVPFLVIHGLGAQVIQGGVTVAATSGMHWLIMLPLSFLGAFLATKFNVPTPRLLGPILATAADSYFLGSLQPVPDLLMMAAQVSIGLYMGVMLEPKKLSATRELMPYIFCGIVLMIGVSVVVAWSMSDRYGFSLITAFLAMAPGGIAEMCLAGMSIGEDVSIILTYQLVRLLFLNICVPLGINLYFKNKITG